MTSTQPAPAGVIDHDAIAKAIWESNNDEYSWDYLTTRAFEYPDADYAEIRDGILRSADAVLAALHTRTVAQVKAEAWDEAVTEACCESCGCLRAKNVPNPYRADELERGDGR